MIWNSAGYLPIWINWLKDFEFFFSVKFKKLFKKINFCDFMKSVNSLEIKRVDD